MTDAETALLELLEKYLKLEERIRNLETELHELLDDDDDETARFRIVRADKDSEK